MMCKIRVSKAILFPVLRRKFPFVRRQTVGLHEHHFNNRCSRWLSSSIEGTLPKNGEGVAIGQFAELRRTFTAQDVENYGTLIGDHNLLHTRLKWDEAVNQMPILSAHRDAGLIDLDDEGDGTKTKILVHGMLVGSLFSSIFATVIPGSVYLNQTLNFKAPVFADDAVIGRVQITRVRKFRRVGVAVECDTHVLCGDKTAVEGIANVWVPSGYLKQDS